MRLKPSLKISARLAPLFSLIICLNLTGCQKPIEPTYKEEDIPYFVKRICKEEYGLDVTTKRTPTTLWIYAPLNKILHKEFGIKEDKLFDEEISDKLRNIFTTIGRVLISSNKTPEFFALLASDINIGLDYTIIGNTLDIKKSYADFIPWTEANRRYVVKLKMEPKAVGDSTGRHLQAYDVKMPDFLSEQMAQRIGAQFQNEERKKYFKVEKSEGKFINNTFVLDYYLTQISKPDTEIDIRKEILNIITYCIKTYNFKDFSMIEINDLAKQDKVILSRAAIWARPTE
jgi:hypothetical protein